MFQRVSPLADSRSRPFRRIAIPFFSSPSLSPQLSLLVFTASSLSVASYHFFRRILPRPTFSVVCTETLSGEPRLWRNSLGFRDVSNVLESAERELNMGISNAFGERAVQISWVARTRGFPARITALLVLHTRDPGKRAVRLRAVTPPPDTAALSCALHCSSPQLDIRRTVEKSSCPIRDHQFSLRVRSDTDSSNGFIWNKVSQFIRVCDVQNPLCRYYRVLNIAFAVSIMKFDKAFFSFP